MLEAIRWVDHIIAPGKTLIETPADKETEKFIGYPQETCGMRFKDVSLPKSLKKLTIWLWKTMFWIGLDA